MNTRLLSYLVMVFSHLSPAPSYLRPTETFYHIYSSPAAVKNIGEMKVRDSLELANCAVWHLIWNALCSLPFCYRILCQRALCHSCVTKPCMKKRKIKKKWDLARKRTWAEFRVPTRQDRKTSTLQTENGTCIHLRCSSVWVLNSQGENTIGIRLSCVSVQRR